MARVDYHGFVTRDPEDARYGADGQPYTFLAIGVDQLDGNGQPKLDVSGRPLVHWTDVVCDGEVAFDVVKIFGRGSGVHVTGDETLKENRVGKRTFENYQIRLGPKDVFEPEAARPRVAHGVRVTVPEGFVPPVRGKVGANPLAGLTPEQVAHLRTMLGVGVSNGASGGEVAKPANPPS